MRTCTIITKSAAAITLVTSSAIATGSAIASADQGGTIVALDSTLRNCDFSAVSTPPLGFEPALATGSVRIHKSGSTAVAEVYLSDSPEPGTHFDVGLIQEPRPTSAGCGPGAPGTAFAGLDTDGAGVGRTTVQDTLRPGTTGVWVIVERPSPHSQDPGEYYTSEFVVPT
ncbi:hypothetical protein A5791_17575 [Mycobacterium sp. 852002-51163_SCH5372311]|nr:hypothetical protein A5791_17575 [Mycobacterium sp. 852002-51163_SCH5372311]